MEQFLEEMGERLVVNNLYVYGAESFTSLKRKLWKNMSNLPKAK